MNKTIERMNDRIKDLLADAAFTLLFTTVIGSMGNIAVLAVGFITAVLHLFDFTKGYFMDICNQDLWILYAVVSAVFCMVGCAWLHTSQGAAAARFSVNCRNRKTINVPFMLVSTGLGTAVHGLLCTIISGFGLPYLFFAAPVQYIARFISCASRSIYADVSFDFPRRFTLEGIAIYTAIIFISSCVGYMIGAKNEFDSLSQERQNR